MKKLAALVLALMMVLAAIPALGEDYSGLWYLNTAGITGGTLELNADSSVVYTIQGEAYNGTWTSNENGVEVTIEGVAILFTANENGLVNEEEQVYLTREPEKISIDQLMNYYIALATGETPELPEGVTQEEMDAALAAVLGGDTADMPVMTYEEYAAAEKDDEVKVSTYVQATQSWWDGKITVYAQSPDGAYFIYNMECSEEDAAKLVAGTPIVVHGYKGEWGGEVEIVEATFEFGEGDPFIAEAEDVTGKIGTDELINDMNKKVSFKGMTIDAIAYKDDKVGEDDIYVTASKDGQVVNFCVEFYLTNAETEVYQTVAALNAGDVVDIEAYLYWYEGANPHVIGVAKAE